MPTAKEVQKKISHKEWKKQISDCKSSNLSVKDWCAANGVNHNTYYGRVAALKRDKWEQAAQDIVPLSSVPELQDVSGLISLESDLALKRKAAVTRDIVVIRKGDIEIVLTEETPENMILMLFRGLKEC